MVFLKFHYLIILFLLCSMHALANERFDSRENSLKRTSSYAVLVTPVEGKIGCDIFNDRWGDGENICHDGKFSEDIIKYNESKKSETFIILKSLKGSMVRGNIVSVNYADVGMNHLHANKIYLIFFHEKNGVMFYEPCDVSEYEKIKDIIDANVPYNDTVNLLLDYSPFSCFQEPPNLIFNPKEVNKGKGKK